ncbi:MAG: D-alanyl-D-alanine carboxypeptidase/D-alanyl-D-alanine-endopeptidase [Flavobacteriaceae bacterium]|nr:D-alanyl-D-alanine carboxypeptidase/D-alanyl-D-alanine-endopeptidase [Flavobacteriaceae bacterium]
MGKKLEQATKEFLKTPEMISANLSFYVADDKGSLIYEYQGNKGLSTASTQKLFMATTALAVLGKDFRYETKLFYTNDGDLVLSSQGDPTLGSWRYEETKPEKIKQSIIYAIKNLGIDSIDGDIIIDDSYFDFQTIPGGWAWNDIGNYYGAGTWGVNWRENQFDLHINGGKNEGDFTKIKGFSYPLVNLNWVNEATSHKGNEDKSIIYTAPLSEVAYINGSLPMGKTTTISGAVPNPPLQLGVELAQWLKESGISFNGKIITASQELAKKGQFTVPKGKEIWLHHSPKMEKIIYWFMRKSVNLYGETLVKTLGKVKNNNPSFGSGMQVLKSFWKDKGIHPAMINFIDGSGLSPQNYASAKAEVQALLWAKKQVWFPVLEESFPIYNQMKMKSGTIKDAKGYVGFHTSKTGKKYIFAVLVNNYHGKNVNAQLFKLLDNLK